MIDWSLAKVVGRPEDARDTAAGETLVPSEPDSGSGDTALGSAVETPAYMNPEQAAGRWDVVDHRSDVYGLGAVLYTVLTGRPPLEKGNWPEIQQRIQRGDFPQPRQVKPAVPRPLEAVCRKAMALPPENRYPSPRAVADDVERWLADEPVSARREPLWERARRLCRRRPVLAVWLGVVTALDLVVISVALLWWLDIPSLAALPALGAFVVFPSVIVFGIFVFFLVTLVAQLVGLLGAALGVLLGTVIAAIRRASVKEWAARGFMVGGKSGLRGYTVINHAAIPGIAAFIAGQELSGAGGFVSRRSMSLTCDMDTWDSLDSYVCS